MCEFFGVAVAMGDLGLGEGLDLFEVVIFRGDAVHELGGVGVGFCGEGGDGSVEAPGILVASEIWLRPASNACKKRTRRFGGIA